MDMSKQRAQKPKPVGYRAGLDAKLNRPAGTHKDQKRRTDHRAMRRDRSYREDY